MLVIIRIIFHNFRNSNEKITNEWGDRQGHRKLFLIQEREQVISYKKKPTAKLQKESRDEDDEIDSAPSLKSGVFSDDSVLLSVNIRFGLIRRTRLCRSSIGTSKWYGTLEKGSWVRVWWLKSKYPITTWKRKSDSTTIWFSNVPHPLWIEKNNYLTTENMKLKTKIMNL